MSESTKELLLNFRALSKIDLQLNQTLAEKNKLNDELTKKNSKVLSVQQQLSQVNDELSKKQRLTHTQEVYLKEEQQKLIARRKSIQTLNDYKLQEKANKEIDQANKQLHLQEEKLLESLDSIDTLSTNKVTLEAHLVALNESLIILEAELKDAFVNLDLKLSELQAEHAELSQAITPKDMNFYKRISARYPGQAVVALSGNSCTGCYFSLSSQIFVQVSRGTELLTCPSCGRILSPEEKAA